MWPFIRPINLIRYLVVWQVNGPLVWLPRDLSPEISLVLGTIVADRLPTSRARHWNKTLAPWGKKQGAGGKMPKTIPDASWPIEVVLFVYPGKRTYGQGELILWELKLMGESADHGLFLELILPAMEEAATTTDSRWHRKHNLWGQFDIHSVYAARGPRWEPVVREGRLDLDYRPTPAQWADGLTFDVKSKRLFDHVAWLTAFDLPATGNGENKASASSRRKASADRAPTLQRILASLVARMTLFLPGKYNTPDDVWDSLSEGEVSRLQAAMEQAAPLSVRQHDIHRASRDAPGRWIGTQTFLSILPPLVPYLELASILHIGRQTHFGCGTFAIS
ncbi:MAG: hypothetical protein MAG451_02929 [Anaerolineales bacterium]|nr:hypothetical protein [Anaerolineales bacterium]